MTEFLSALLGFLVATGLIAFCYLGPMLSECELNLPRTQHCVLTAVPAQGEKP